MERAASEMGRLGGKAAWAKRKAKSTPEELAKEQKTLASAGGKARWAGMTAEEKREKAVTMARTRWAKPGAAKGGRPRKPAPPILLPQTSFKRGNQLAHVRLLTAVRHSKKLGQWLFEGEIHKPGTMLRNPPAGAVVIECAGAAAPGKHAGLLWILWQRVKDEWIELARSCSKGREWTGDLGPRAASVLNPRPKLFDPVDRVNVIVAEIAAFVDLKLDTEPEGIALGVLLALGDQINGRVAQNDTPVSRAELFSA